MPAQVLLSKRSGRLGVSCIDSPDESGAVCSALIEDSSAYRAGLNVGDCITAVNGQLVGGHRECIAAIDAAPDRVAFVLSRPTRRVVLDKRSGRIGVTLMTPHSGSGVLVSALEEGSLAFDAGLFVGDTILSINGCLAHSHAEGVALIDESPVVELVVVASTRQVTINKRSSGPPLRVGLTVADRVDGGAGVVVLALQPGSIAIRQLQLGDTILSVNDELVTSHADAIARIDASPAVVTLVLGERSPDFSAVLNSVHQSTSTGGMGPLGPDACGPVLTRHGPLQEVHKNS